MRPVGQVVGRAGHGLRGDTSWAGAGASTLKAAASAEDKTAARLNALAQVPGGPTVLHDLRIPIPGFKANIDHLLVSGEGRSCRVLPIDTKWWAPGFLWTLGGSTRRGWSTFPEADKKTMLAATRGLEALLRQKGLTEARVLTPLVLIWPSSSRATLSTWALRIPGARGVHAEKGLRSLGHSSWRHTADPYVVRALTPLVASLDQEAWLD